MASKGPYCVDCRHWYVPMVGMGMAAPMKYGRCQLSRDVVGMTDYAGVARGKRGVCGPTGKLFEPIPPRKSLWQRLFGGGM